MAAHADNHARARNRAAYPQLTTFAADLGFDLDPFQIEACEALEDGHGALVAAPTGAGKTVVGEFAVHLALHAGRKCFYTTPIKALSNQKYNDLIRRYGPEKVGLLTGDRTENGNAPIVVMTTEVLRNMLYTGSAALTGLGFVVMDEVHYLADRFRGAVWEEVIIHLPESVALVSLSATVSNAEEFGAWLVAVRGNTAIVVSDERPVPLWQHMMVGTRLFDLFSIRHASDGVAAPSMNPQLEQAVRTAQTRVWSAETRGRGSGRHRNGSAGFERRQPWRPPHRADVVARLDRDGLLPAITFIFSRAGCDAAVVQVLRSGLRLTSDEERGQISAVVDEHCGGLPDEDLAVLGYWDWLEALRAGIAAHHAGLIPAFKETVEELFVRGLVKAVFATETLALGINMPARSVVLERLNKWNGDQHAALTAGEYTQLTGRAGRRGIDIDGHAVVLWSPEVDVAAVAGLASTRTYPLRSSFSPSYNMAANLVAQLGRKAARELLGSSFAQFQADRDVVGLQRRVAANEKTLADFAAEWACDRGDFATYDALRMTLGQREAHLSRQGARERQGDAIRALEALRVGDVIRVPHGRRQGLAVVLDPGISPLSDPRPLVLTEQRWAGRLSGTDFPVPALPLARIRVPRNFNHRSPVARRDLASSLRTARTKSDLGARQVTASRRRAAAADREIAAIRSELRAHPCHHCPDREDHARWTRRWSQLKRETDGLRARIDDRTGSIPRSFDRICDLLEHLGYLTGRPPPDALSESGRGLTRIWSETDLAAAQCLREGVFDGLGPDELAACVSTLVYEARRDVVASWSPPTPLLGERLVDLQEVTARLRALESEHGIALTRELDPGFAESALRWARGESLDRVLRSAREDGTELTGGDFVRWMRQLIDLLGQLARVGDLKESTQSPGAADRNVARVAARAVKALRRGVVEAGDRSVVHNV
ncbi:MAG: DEAD/DEAH box helicase [Geodermatophilaceae bacterium]|nr:DEAD/DEAH box helicase [Geodermatophilaceae bacterium]